MSDTHRHEAFFERLARAALALPSLGKGLIIYPHLNADGDAIGSAMAVALLMEKFGIDCLILTEEEVSHKLCFLPETTRFVQSIKEDQDLIADYGSKQGLALVIDSPGGERIGKRLTLFNEANWQFTLDHHIPTKENDDSTLVDITAAASCELVTEFILFLEKKYRQSLLTEAMAINLFCGLMTDTGRFTYSNTTAQTLRMAAELLRFPVDIRALSLQLFGSMTKAKLTLTAYTFNCAQYYYDDRMLISVIPYSVYAASEGEEGDVEGLAASLRDVIGVELSILLKETSQGGYRASVRSGDGCDAQKLAMQFNGGGHLRAAGYTLTSMDEAEAIARCVAAAKSQFEA